MSGSLPVWSGMGAESHPRSSRLSSDFSTFRPSVRLDFGGVFDRSHDGNRPAFIDEPLLRVRQTIPVILDFHEPQGLPATVPTDQIRTAVPRSRQVHHVPSEIAQGLYDLAVGAVGSPGVGHAPLRQRQIPLTGIRVPHQGQLRMLMRVA